jgi:hypothetical protein
MAKKNAAAAKRDRLGDLVQLQHHVVAHTSEYFRRLSELAAQGSIEPRAYVEEYFGLWANVLDEIGDWWKPKRVLAPREELVSKVSRTMRPEKGDFRFEVPIEVFDRHRDAKFIYLSTDGLVRTFDPKKRLREAVTLSPEQNVRVHPTRVTRTGRWAAYKVFAAESIVMKKETYQGVVWGSTSPKGTRFPVAMIELKIV